MAVNSTALFAMSLLIALSQSAIWPSIAGQRHTTRYLQQTCDQGWYAYKSRDCYWSNIRYCVSCDYKDYYDGACTWMHELKNIGICYFCNYPYCFSSKDQYNACEMSYIVGGGTMCFQCLNGCKTCDNRNTCNLCLKGYFKTKANSCEICSVNCLNCENKTECTVCDKSSVLLNGSCILKFIQTNNSSTTNSSNSSDINSRDKRNSTGSSGLDLQQVFFVFLGVILFSGCIGGVTTNIKWIGIGLVAVGILLKSLAAPAGENLHTEESEDMMTYQIDFYKTLKTLKVACHL